MKRVLIPNTGPIAENIRKAFSCSLKICEELRVNELTLVLPTKNNFLTSVVAGFIGEPAAKQLVKSQSVQIQGTVSMRLETPATLKKGANPKLVLAFYISSKDLTVVDSLLSTRAVVFVPWLEQEGTDWQRTWNAEIFEQPNVTTEPLLSNEIKEGLSRLTGRINLSTGLAHSSDKQAAKDLFANFRAANISYEPTQIRVWAVRNGWTPNDANELMKLSEKYLG